MPNILRAIQPNTLRALCAAATVFAAGCGGGPVGADPDPSPPPSSTTSTTSTAVRPVPTQADVAYAQASPQQTLDLYLPANGDGAAAPLVIWIHGGGFVSGDKRAVANNNLLPPPRAAEVPADGGPLVIHQVQVPDVAALNAKGYAVASLNYRLGSFGASPEQMASAAQRAVQDAKAAVRFLRANAARFHIDPERFAAWGNSAGGFVAVTLGVTGQQATPFDEPAPAYPGQSAAVQAVVDWFGLVDGSTLDAQILASSACGYIRTLSPIGSLVAELSRRFGPLAYISSAPSLPPFSIAHGDADCAAPLGQSQQLQAALARAHANATLSVVPGAGHEDPAFMGTQMAPTLAFLDATIGRPRQ